MGVAFSDELSLWNRDNQNPGKCKAELRCFVRADLSECVKPMRDKLTRD